MDFFKRFLERTIRFFKDLDVELHRVTWPSRQAVIEHTVMVIFTIIFFGTFLWLVDIVAQQLLRLLLARVT